MTTGTERILAEARARICWGHPAPTVRAFLVEKGVAPVVADARILELVAERSRMVRRMGLRHLLAGVLITGSAGLILWGTLPPVAEGGLGLQGRRGQGGTSILIAWMLYGFWRLAKGLVYLLRPQSEHRPVTDIPY